MLKLQVLICTHATDGLSKVAAMTMPHVDGVGYLVSCQSSPLPIPSVLNRDDVQIYFNNTIGVSNNRNISLDLATAPYVLLADDDLHYNAEGLLYVIETFENNPDISIAAFKSEGGDKRKYPSGQVELYASKARRHYPYVIELAFRRADIERIGLHFSPLAGINAPYLGAGEEDLFVFHALKSGLKGMFFPHVIVNHPGTSTGFRRSPAMLRARGAVLRIIYPFSSPLRMLRLSMMLDGNTIANFWHMTKGWIYACRHRREL